MASVTATKMKKKTIATTLTVPGIVLLHFVPDVLDESVVPGVRPADIDARQQPGGEDDADADRDAESDVRGDLHAEDALLERDQENETVVDDQRDRRQDQGDSVLARREEKEFRVL